MSSIILNNCQDSIIQICNKWQSCEASKRKLEQTKYSIDCRLQNLVRLCNYVLISFVLLVCLINGNAAIILGCSSNPCIFGVCIDDLNSSYSCYCIDGYTGRNCQTNWDECWSSPCWNGGTCIDGVASYNCTCLDGFNGVNCQENLDECLSNPCQNYGTCEDRNGGYVCYCSLGYAGIHCELDVAVCDTGSGNKCHNGGQCVEGRGLDFTCDCAPGWVGRFCSIEIDECENSPCLNGAVCIDKVGQYACVCAKGFTGQNCEEDIHVCNDSPCSHGALCLMEEGQPVCYCVPDFHGEKCEYQYDECQIGPRCSNGGQCVDGVDDFSCKCENDFKGMFCECLQTPSGNLACNFTSSFDQQKKTPKVEASTTKMYLSSSTTIQQSDEITPMPTDSSFVYRSTITQSVPTTSFDSSFSYSTIEILDRNKSTESTTLSYESSTNDNESPFTSLSSDSSTKFSSTIFIATDTESSPSSSTIISTDELSSERSISLKIHTTRPTISKTTTKPRPCPPDIVRKSTTSKAFTTTTIKETSESSSSTFPTEASSAQHGTYTDNNLQSLATDEQSSSSMETTNSYATKFVVASLKTESPESAEVTSQEPLETSEVDNLESTSTTSLAISFETEKTPYVVSSSTIDIATSTLESSTGVIASSSTRKAQVTISHYSIETDAPTATSQFQLPTTETTFTVSNINETDCKHFKCFNGGSCVETSEGPKCVCRFDRQDPHCRSLVRIKNAAFAGDSYLSHLIYSDNHKDFDIKPLENVLPINVELKARTRATDGLIMLAIAQGLKGGHYTALFLHKGLLQFQFSCGLQTMLLSEIEAPINTGHEFTIQVALDFSRNHSHCNASLRINDTLAMSGDQPTWLGLRAVGKSKIINSIWLHLGGSPQTPVVLMSELPGGQGFTGCLHNLRINENPKEIFRDAYDGFSIVECGSLACLSNPCRNGGTCEEKLFKYQDHENDINGAYAISSDKFENRWKCKCQTGYLGTSCEMSVCDNNPCNFGGTCVEFPGSGYLCLCPLGKHGHYCEHNLEIDQPSFSGSVNGLSSYISYPVPIPLESTLDLSFKITPTTSSQISLLAFLGQNGLHDEKSDHLAVSFIQGYVMLTWSLGSGPRRIFTQKPLEFHDGEDDVISYHIQVIRQGRTASLYIDGKMNVTGNSPGDVSRLDVAPILYIGGHSLTNFSTLPHDLPLHSGFQGCIYDLQLKSGSLVVPLHETRGIIGRSVGQCGTRECHKHACHNNGACLQHGATYTCICPDGWFGTLCSQKMNPCDVGSNKCDADSRCVPLINSYECDCPIGKIGKNCDVAMKYLSDVSMSGKRSYFALNWANLTHDSAFSKDRYRQPMRRHDVDIFAYDTSSKLLARNIVEHQRKAQLFSIEFQLRPLSESGMLLFLGDLNDNGEGFISLSMKGGVIEYRIGSQQGQLSIVKSNRVLAIGEWHKIRISQNGRRLSLWVEGSSSSNLLQPNSNRYLSINTLMYVGGLPDMSKLPLNSISGFPTQFKGCVRQFHINGHRYVLNEQTIVESRNINDCDGSPCGGDSCDLGGDCYLDDKLNPHCKCPETAKGIHCETPESCLVIKCKNGGKCMPNGECSCLNGWGGYFCEIATNRFSLPSFNGKSYMIVPSQRYTHKDKRNGAWSHYNNRAASKLLQISLNFSTITDGMLLWNQQDGAFFGLGLANSFLKVVSNMFNFTNEFIDVPAGVFLTDGGWHNIKLEIDEKVQIWFMIDQKLVYNGLHSPEDKRHFDLLGKSFFFGGFPANTSLDKQTMNHFHKPFSGCLQNIHISSFTHKNLNFIQSMQPAQHSSLILQDFSGYEGENIGECELYDEFFNIV